MSRLDMWVKAIDAAFKEEDHPRAENGQFTSGGGSGSSGGDDEWTQEKANSYFKDLKNQMAMINNRAPRRAKPGTYEAGYLVSMKYTNKKIESLEEYGDMKGLESFIKKEYKYADERFDDALIDRNREDCNYYEGVMEFYKDLAGRMNIKVKDSAFK